MCLCACMCVYVYVCLCMCVCARIFQCLVITIILWSKSLARHKMQRLDVQTLGLVECKPLDRQENNVKPETSITTDDPNILSHVS
jgi:hypothetical protein